MVVVVVVVEEVAYRVRVRIVPCCRGPLGCVPQWIQSTRRLEYPSLEPEPSPRQDHLSLQKGRTCAAIVVGPGVTDSD